MKKILIFIAFIFFAFCALTVSAACTSQSSEEAEKIAGEVYDIIDDDTKQTLEQFGLDGIDFENVYSFSVSGISKFFSQTLVERLKEVLALFLTLCGVLLVLCAVSTLCGGENEETMQCLCCVVMCIFSVYKMGDIINAVLAVLDLSSKFVLSYIPIFASLIALGGNPSGALSYNTLVMAFAQGLSAFCAKFAPSVVGGFYCLSICFSFCENVNLSRFTSAFSKFTGAALGFLSSIFAATLSIKGILGSGVDSVASRGIRFAVSSMIPIVGSAISEAYSAIIGSIGLIKGSVAAVGIIVCLVINIPALVIALLYYIMLSVLSFFAQAFSMQKVSGVLHALATGLRFLLLLVVFEMFILIISTGLMLLIKSAA